MKETNLTFWFIEDNHYTAGPVKCCGVCVCVVENRCGCIICPKNIFRFHITGKTFGLNSVFLFSDFILFYFISKMLFPTSRTITLIYSGLEELMF